jgi:hypothetical protein
MKNKEDSPNTDCAHCHIITVLNTADYLLCNVILPRLYIGTVRNTFS